jgi:2-oxoglutarate ferredoxin oxidoreductase subunit beta
VRIVQRCPEWLPATLDPWMNDPNRVQILHHADGLQPSAGLSKIYKNQLEHDPINIDRAREIASQGESIPVGILYRNPAVPCYEDLRRPDRLVTPEWTRSGLNTELDKYTVWPQNESRPAA